MRDDCDEWRNWAGCCFNGSPNPCFRAQAGGPHPDKAAEEMKHCVILFIHLHIYSALFCWNDSYFNFLIESAGRFPRSQDPPPPKAPPTLNLNLTLARRACCHCT